MAGKSEREESHHSAGSIPILSFTSARIRCLQPRCRFSRSETIFACAVLLSEEFVYLSVAAEIEPEVRFSWPFGSYLLVPGCHTFLILHGIAETCGLDAELAKSVQGHQPAMRVECHDMGEDAAEREGLSRFAQSVDERIIPGGAVSDVTEKYGSIQHRSFRAFAAALAGSAAIWEGRSYPYRLRTARRSRLPS